MYYSYQDLELCRALPLVAIADEQSGLAVLVRYQSRPVGFWMEEVEPGTTISAAALADRVHLHAGEALVAAQLRAELPPLVSQVRLPSLTVAVCTRGRPHMVRRCLGALCAVAQPAGLPDLELVVVDNAPPDDATRRVVAAFPNVRYVEEAVPGLNFGRNRALEEARGEWIAYVDDDAVVDVGWLRGWAEAYAEHSDAGAITGQVLPLMLETEAQVLFERRGGFRKGFRKIRFGPSHPNSTIYPCGAGIFGTGANMAFRRDVLRELGGFDVALDTGADLPGGGDHDMFYRLVRAGYSLVYEPSFLVFHEHRREMAALHRQYADSWGRALMALTAKMYRQDPSQRAKVRALLRWWMRMQLGRVKRAFDGREPVPLRTIAAEVWGGVVGLAGEYERSVRRVARVQEGRP